MDTRKRGSGATIVALAVLAISIVSCGKGEADANISGSKTPSATTINFIEGTVTLDGVKAALGDIVKQGATITTGDASACEIVFRDRNIIRVSAKTTARFDLSTTAKSIDLERGIVSQVLKNLEVNPAGDSFTVRTASAALGVRGTSFCINAAPAWTYVCACNGTLHLSDADGKNAMDLSSPHHKAVKYRPAKGGGFEVVPAGLEYHTDADVEALAAKIGYAIDWTKVD